MKKPTLILALLAVLTASPLFAKGGYTGGSCGNGGGGGKPSVPDAASTTMLVGVALGALGAGRRFFRR
jgi:hypothetical protein